MYAPHTHTHTHTFISLARMSEQLLPYSTKKFIINFLLKHTHTQKCMQYTNYMHIYAYINICALHHFSFSSFFIVAFFNLFVINIYLYLVEESERTRAKEREREIEQA